MYEHYSCIRGQGSSHDVLKAPKSVIEYVTGILCLMEVAFV